MSLSKSNHAASTAYLLSRAAIATAKKYNKGKDPIAFQVMAVLKNGPMPVRRLANIFSVKSSYMSGCITKLENAGLIEKITTVDQRYRVIKNIENEKTEQILLNELGRISSIIFKDLSENEIELLAEILSRINLDVDKIVSGQPDEIRAIFDNL